MTDINRITITDEMIERGRQAREEHYLRVSPVSCTCGWESGTPIEADGLPRFEAHLVELALEAAAPLIAAERPVHIEGEDMTGPVVTLEWDANDEGPPCIDFTCPCGHWQHLCIGPDWITEGIGQVPGVKCVKCGAAWSLYRVRAEKPPHPKGH